MLHNLLAAVLTAAPFLLPVIIINRLMARRKYRRRMARIPIRSTKADAKRAAKQYAEELAGKSLSWKAARKKLARLTRDGRALGAIGR
jgi:hypothetical protein